MASIFGTMGKKREPEIDLIRHNAIKTIKSAKSKFRMFSNEIVLCCDDKKYWRKDYFPYYKTSRKEAQQKMNVNWESVYNIVHTLKDEFREYLPYKILQCDKVEGDDIIATLIMRYNTEYPAMVIISRDKDFVQLQRFPNVQQYDFVSNRKLIEENPIKHLQEHILSGDRVDSIPNILSADHCLTNHIAQNKITAKRKKLFFEDREQFFEDYPESARNFIRNETLIDLTKIPEEVQDKIINTYEEAEINSKSKLTGYLLINRLKQHLEDIGSF